MDDFDQEAPLATLTGWVASRQEFVVVHVWWDGSGDIAFRPVTEATFGPPSPLAKVDSG